MKKPNLNKTAIVKVLSKESLQSSFKIAKEKLKKPKILSLTIVATVALTATLFFIFHVDEEGAYAKGQSYYKEGEFKKAVETLEKTSDIKNINLLGNSYNQLKKPKKAIEAYTKAIEEEENVTLILNRGNVYTKEGMYDKAEADFKKAIKLDPKEPLGYVNLGVVYGETDRLFEALKMYKKAKKLGFKDADTYIENTNMMYQEDLQKMDKYGELKKVEANPNEGGEKADVKKEEKEVKK